MSQQSSKPRSTNHSRCRYSTVDGRRCRLRVLDDQSGLCFRHVRLNQSQASAPDPELLAAELLGSIEDFQTAEAVNLFLGNLLKQLAAQRIERRDAIALAYISQLLLSSLPALDRQRAEERQARELDEIAKSIKAYHAARLAAASAAASLLRKPLRSPLPAPCRSTPLLPRSLAPRSLRGITPACVLDTLRTQHYLHRADRRDSGQVLGA